MSEEEMTGGPGEDDRKLFVGGLPQEAVESDLNEYFQKFGGVSSVTLKMDQMTGRSRGFAFVVFEQPECLDAVLTQEHVVKGKKIACKKATSKQGKIYVGKFTDGSITEDIIREHFSAFGTVVDIQRPVDRSKNSEPKNFCFVTFDKEGPAEELLKQKTVMLNGQEVEIKKVTMKQDMRGRGRYGYDSWGPGYDGGWGAYGGPMGGPWGGGYPGYGGWGGWSGGYGGGKVGAATGGFRGGRGGSRGRNAPY